MTRLTVTGALVAATALTAAPLAAQSQQGDQTGDDRQESADPLSEAEVRPLTGWTYDSLYADGMSADDFMAFEVRGSGGEEIGDMEDLLISSEGEVVAIIAEVGGFWDIGDTHVSVPYDEIEMDGDAATVTVPVTEETVEDYDFMQDAYAAGDIAEETVPGVDDADFVPRAWRVSELIGDYARMREGDTFVNYGYVSDLILKEGQVDAVVVQPMNAYGTGYRAYPYAGYEQGWGWNPGSPYYDMPYDMEMRGELGDFDYDQMGS
ncbi:PRC-barrel domain-containing protein [Rhodosalinus sp.]|uniref:PRC-barrel domain-containing protein n=1 Tax=Rhodosalinus sp. TaxID=2047741 RepID=UPI00397B72F3